MALLREAAPSARYHGHLQPFSPLVRNPHLLTIFANFAPRRLDVRRFPVRPRLYATEPGVEVLVHEQQPDGRAQGQVIGLHGLEGSSAAGYLRSLAQVLLESGYGVHRANMRSCGGTEPLANTMYHAGLTSDTLAILRQLKDETGGPLYLVGYSLGGNVALKLAGELAEHARGLLDGVAAISAPIDLAACVRAMGRRENRIYDGRFLAALKRRIRRRARSLRGIYDLDALAGARSVYEFDDRITARFFDFGTADNYYATQSSNQFLEHIRVPALLVTAQDDPLVPFDIYRHPAIEANPKIRLLAVEHGGHMGFLAARKPRYWVDRAILAWFEELQAAAAPSRIALRARSASKLGSSPPLPL
ncbi:MAG: alpha/beta fold hydrolase [Acidobacteria bacterium]|nr:alpha/beta fold hydrolase [Acidobacteriota bacterium]MBI3278251.1 alpha/beta fold hydrolase [Acidobacteriota bacterium]